MKKTSRISRLLAMLLALAMIVNSQGMTAMAAVIGGVTGNKKQTEAPQTETEKDEAQESEKTDDAELESESESESLTPAEKEAMSEVAAETELAAETEVPAETEAETELESEAIVEEETEATGVYTYEDDTMIVTATVSDPTAIPADAKFVVEKVEISADELAQAEEAIGEDKEIANYVAYDMHFELEDGTEIEPQCEVAVKVDYKKDNDEDFGSETMNNDAAELQVIHLDEQLGAEDVTTDATVTEEGAVSSAAFATDSFSIIILSQVVEKDRTFVYEDKNVKITAEVGEEEDLNSNLVELKMDIVEDASSEEYKELVEAVNKAEKGENTSLLGLRAYKFSFVKDGEEIQPTGEIEVTIEHKNNPIPEDIPENWVDSTSFYQTTKNGSVRAINADVPLGDNNVADDATMTIDNYGIIEAFQRKGNQISRQDILEALGIAPSFAVFAEYFTNNNHMEGAIAVQHLQGSSSQIGNTDNVTNFNPATVNLNIKKKATGPNSAYQTYHFGIYKKNETGDLEQIKIEDVYTDEKGEGSVEVKNLGEGTYYVYELDDNSTPIKDSGAKATVNGQEVTVEYSSTEAENTVVLGGVGNKSYVEFFEKPDADQKFYVGDKEVKPFPGCDVELFNTNNHGKSTVVIGSTNSQVAHESNQAYTWVVGKDGSKYLINTQDHTIIEQAGEPFPISFSTEMSRLEELSKALADAKTSDTVKVISIPTRSDLDGDFGNIDVLGVVADGIHPYTEHNQWDHDILKSDGKFVVLNVDCTNAGNSVELKGVRIDGTDPQNWNKLANSIIWNFYTKKDGKVEAYRGTIKYKGGIGTILAPRATVTCTSSTNGSVIGHKVDHPTCEIHHIALRESSTTVSKTVSCSNTAEEKKLGSLKIEKNVTINGQSVKDSTLVDGTYKFTITDPNGNNREVSITVLNGKSKPVQIDDLEPGVYTVTEDTKGLRKDITLTTDNPVTVTVTAGNTAGIPTASFTNNRTVRGQYSFGGQKTVNLEDPAADETFRFTLSELKHNNRSEYFWDVIDDTENIGKPFSFELIEYEPVFWLSNNKIWYLIEEKPENTEESDDYVYSDAKYVVLVELPYIGEGYYVGLTEAKITYYKVKDDVTNVDQLIKNGGVDTSKLSKPIDPSAVIFDNKHVGKLSVTKQVFGDEPIPQSTYTVTVTSNKKYDLSDVTANAGVTVNVREDKHSVTFSFTAGQTVTLENLPVGMYTVTEATGNYTTQYVVEDGTARYPAVIEVKGNSDAQVTIKNTYKAEVSYQFIGKKVLENKDLEVGEFSFEIYKDGKTTPETTVTNGNYGDNLHDFIFSGDYLKCSTESEIFFPHTHTYVIKEKNTGKDGIVYAENDYTITVTVTKGDDGKLSATVDGATLVEGTTDTYRVGTEEAAFKNTYDVKGSIEIVGKKVLENKDLESDDVFEFEIVDDVTKEVVASGTNDASGKITFTDVEDAFTYTLAEIGGKANSSKTFTYTIREKTGTDSDIEYDETTRKLEVTVSDNGSGTLSFTVKLDGIEITPATGTNIYTVLTADNAFTNTYTTEKTITLDGHKTMEGRDLTESYGFDFNVYKVDADGNKTGDRVATGSTNKDGNITFSPDIKVTLADMLNEDGTYASERDFKYVVEEDKEADDDQGEVGYAENKDLTLHATYSKATGELDLSWTSGLDNGKAEFVNDYNTSASATLDGRKVMEGRDLQGGESYSFSVYAKGGVTVADDGTATVTDASKKVFGGTAAGPDWNIKFNGGFEYNLKEDFAIRDEAGNITGYKTEETYTYYVVEDIPEESERAEGVTYDRTAKEVTVTVTYNKATGVMTATVDKGKDGVTFTNTYTTEKSLGFELQKELEGMTLTGGQFQFKLEKKTSADDAEEATWEQVGELMTNDADGKVSFKDAIKISLDDLKTVGADGSVTYPTKTFTYRVSEVKGDLTDMTYAEGFREFTVTALYDKATGVLTLTDTLDHLDGTFTNTWNAEASVPFEATKKLVGRDLKVGEFHFEVYNASDVDVKDDNTAEVHKGAKPVFTQASNEVNGHVALGTKTYTPADIEKVVDGKKTYPASTLFEYVVIEVVDDAEEGTEEEAESTITYDRVVRKVTVEVTYDQTTKEMGASIVKDETDDLTFTNYYDTKKSITLDGHKTLEGRNALEGETFSFNVYKADEKGNKSGEAVATASTDGEGDFTFKPEITITLDDMRTDDRTDDKKATYASTKDFYYLVEEEDSGAEGMTYAAPQLLKLHAEYAAATGELTINWVGLTDNRVEFVNDYDTNAEATITGKKVMEGRDLQEGETYSFSVYKQDDVLFDDEGNVTGTKAGAEKVFGGSVTGPDDTITFDGSFEYELKRDFAIRDEAGKITGYKTEETYSYYVVEDIPEESKRAEGVTYDRTAKPVTVTVTYDKTTGDMQATVAEGQSNVTFTNKYTTEKTITLDGHKTMEGRDLADDYGFDFNAYKVDADGNKTGDRVATGSTNKDGNITFSPDIKVTLADMLNEDGTYASERDFKYVVEEDKEADDDQGEVGYAENKDLTLHATYSKATGELDLSWTSGLDNGKAEFVNDYNTSASATLDGRKVMEGRDLQGGESYSFSVYAKGGVTVADDGTATVTDASKKVFGGTAAGPDWNIKFNGGFEYNLKEDFAIRDEAGNITGYKTEETYTYYVVEDIPEESERAEGVTYDRTAKEVTVTVTYNKATGVMTATVDKGKDGVTFTNTYTTEKSLGFELQKELEGMTLTGGQFQFKLEKKTSADDAEEATWEQVGELMTNDADGKVSFKDAIKISLDDLKTVGADGSVTYPTKTFTYRVSEVKGDLTDMTYAEGFREFTVTALYDKATGVLTLTDTLDHLDGTFTNTWNAEASVPFEATKKLVGRDLKVGEFHFEVYNASDVDVKDDNTAEVHKGAKPVFTQASNEVNGHVALGTKTYTPADIEKVVDGKKTYPASTLFEYVVIEVVDDAEEGTEEEAESTITYDRVVRKVTVEVTYDQTTKEMGASIVKDETDDLTFTNYYDTKKSITLDGHKTLEGRNALEGETFSFNVYKADEKGNKSGEAVATASTDGEGDFTFKPEITITLDDMRTDDRTDDKKATYASTKDFYYLVEEEDSGAEGMTYAAPQLLKLHAEYAAATGELTINWVGLTDNRVEFVNDYDTNAEATITGKKVMEGRDLQEGETYSFSVYKQDDVLFDDEGNVTGTKAGAEKVFGGSVTGPDDTITFDGSFEYELKRDFAIRDEAGKITGYKTEETYSYYVVEDIPEESKRAEGVTYDRTAKPVTVTVTYNKATGNMEATVAEGQSNVTFTNEYDTEDTIGLDANKTLEGRELKQGEFIFTLSEGEGQDTLNIAKASVTNAANGTVKFADDVIKVTLADMDGMAETAEKGVYTKQFKYTLTEAKTSLKGVTNDADSKRELTLTATYNENTGVLELAWDTNMEGQTFINTYDTEAKESLEAEKELKGRKLKAGEFIFTLSEGEGQDTLDISRAMVLNDADGKVKFADGLITVTFADMEGMVQSKEDANIFTKEFTYVLTEAKTKLKGVTNDPVSARTLTLEATYNKATGELALEWKNTPADLKFTNTYDTDAKTGVELTKELTGLDLKGSAFTFRLEKLASGNAGDKYTLWQTIATAANDADGRASFADAIVVTLDDLKVNDANTADSYPDKTFTYRVSEVKPDDADEAMIYDDEVYTFTVDAHYDFENGVLTLTNDAPTDGYTFKNEWTAEAGIPLTGFKTQKDLKLEEGKYGFAVYNADDVTVAEDGTVTTTGEPVLGPVTNAAEGGIVFGTLEYDLDDIKDADGNYPAETIFEYKVLELKGTDKGVTYDPSVKTVRVKVTYSMATGKLEAALIDGTELLAFVNEYDTEDTIGLEAEKELKGRKLKAGEFIFTLSEGEDQDTLDISRAMVLNDADGKVKFADDVIKVTLDDMADVLATPSADGIYTKQFTYVLTEAKTKLQGVTNDANSSRELTLTATYNKNTGVLDLAWDTDMEGQTFINTYDTEAKESLEAEKELKGRKLKAGEFIFTLSESGDQDTLDISRAMVLNDADGKVKFADGLITVTLADMAGMVETEEGSGIFTKEFTYVLTEAKTKLKGVTNDADSSRELKLVATYNNESGELTLEWKNAPEALKFVNEYDTYDTIGLDANKTLEGRELKQGEFIFTLSEGEGQDTLNIAKASVTNAADGTVKFADDVIKVTLDDMADVLETPSADGIYTKQFTYVLTEAKTGLKGVTNDANSSRELTLTATYNENTGVLELAWDTGMEDQTFINTYDTEAKESLEAEKELKGRKLKAGEFIFTLSESGDQDTLDISRAMVLNDADGTVKFADGLITVTLADMEGMVQSKEDANIFTKEFTYVLTEAKTKLKGVTNDANSSRELTLEATYNRATGELTLEWKNAPADLKFTNTYDTQEKTGVDLTKELTGLDLKGSAFTFRLEKQIGANGKFTSWQTIATAANDADGRASFADAIVVTLDDLKVNDANTADSYPDKTFTYRVSEVKPDDADEAMIYDENAYTFTVVAHYDFASGTIELTNNADPDGYTFENEWTAEASIPLTGFKTQKDLKLEAGKYSFAVYKADDVTVAEDGTVTTTGEPVLGPVTNAAEGGIVFGTLEYDLDDIVKDGEYPAETVFEYKVLELKGTDKGVTYDPSVKTVKVKVTYSMATGELKAALIDGSELLAFVNEYDTEDTIGFEAAKEMHGRELTEEDVFTFTLTADDEAYAGTVQTATAENDANGAITGFKDSAIKVTLDDMADVLATPSADGIYTKQFSYTLTESGERPSVTNDPNAKHLTVTATYDKNSGDLKLMLTKWDNLTFINTYEATGSVPAGGLKKVNGKPVTSEQIERLNKLVEFQLEQVDGAKVTPLESKSLGADGTFKFTDLAYTQDDIGNTYTYRIKESQIADDDEMGGYTVDGTVYTFMVKVEDSDEHDGTLKLTVTDAEGNVAEGEPKLEAEFDNELTVEFHVNKTEVGDNSKEVEGARLTVYEVTTDENGDTVETEVDSWISKEGETHDFGDKLEEGKSYVLRETVAPDGYAYTTDIEFSVTDNGEIETGMPKTTDEDGNDTYLVEDAPLHFNVNKTEVGDNSKEVADAEITVYELTTDEEGNTVETKVDSWISKEGETHDFGGKLKAGGSYVMRETVAPDGYAYTNDIEFTVDKDGKVTTDAQTVMDEDGNPVYLVEDAPLHFNVNKTEIGDNSKEVADAEITVYELTTDEEGNRVETKVDSWTSKAGETHDFGDKLKAGGSYVMRETVAPDGYAYTNDIEFTIDKNGKVTTDAQTVTDEDGNTVYLVEDAPLHFNVNKTEVGDNSKEVAGAEITVYELTTDEEGNTVETKVDSWTSKEGETHDFGDKLKAGGSYVMRETVAPDGYAYTNDIEFTIDKNGKVTTDAQTVTDEDGNTVYLVEDAPLHFNVNKTEVGDNSKEVAGAEITVYELTTDEEGNTVETKVDSWTSKEGETHDFGDKLKAGGSYVMRETVAPDGYAYTNDIEFTVDRDGKVTTDAQTVTDEDGNTVYLVEDAPLHFNVNKTEVGDNSKEVAGAEITVYELTTDEEGNTVETKVDSWTSKEGETHDFGDKLKAGGSYVMRETVAPDGYAYTNDIEFTVDKDGKVTTDAQTVTDEDGTPVYLVEDAPLHFHVDKVELGNGEELDGAELTVYEVTTDENGNRVETKVDSWTSKKGENHDFGGKLKAGGSYVLREELAPAGYAYTSDIEFTVDKDGKVAADMPTTTDADGNTVYLVEDAPIIGSVTLRKTSEANGEVLAGAAFQLYYKTDETESGWALYNNAAYVTGIDGTLTIGGLTANDYYFVETEAPEGFVIATDEDGKPKQYPFTIGPDEADKTKAEVSVTLDVTNAPEEEDTKLVVTKQLVYDNELWNAVDATFYVALFDDEALTNRVSEVQAIEFKDRNTSSTTFENLEAGKTYYVAETLEDGTVVNDIGGVLATGEMYTADFYNDNVVTVEKGDGTTVLYFRNVFTEIPEEFYREGRLTITKQLLGADGVLKASNKTFYAGIFADAEFTKLSEDVSQNIVKLALEGKSSVSDIVTVTVPEDGETTVYVTEVDKNGNPVAGSASFRYDVSVDGTAVTMDVDHLEGKVVITNQEREKETETEGYYEDETDTVPEKTKAVKTGDETPIALYIGLLLAAAVLLIAAFLLKRRKKNRG